MIGKSPQEIEAEWHAEAKQLVNDYQRDDRRFKIALLIGVPIILVCVFVLLKTFGVL